MTEIIEIEDIEQAELDVYARLTQAQLRSRQHEDKGLFIAEGLKVIEHALDAGYTPVSFLMERKHCAGKARALLDRCGDIPVYTGAETLLCELTGFCLSRGVLCAMRRPHLHDAETVCRGARRIAVLEDITDSTNVGAIFRAAAALDMDAVLLTPSCCDPLHRRAVRVSMGAVFQIPWAYIPREAWEKEGVKTLEKMGFSTVAMALDDKAFYIDDPRLAVLERMAIILGTEGDGLSYATITQSEYSVMIPMAHGVDSLNVAAASAVAFWQLGRLNRKS